MKRSNALGCFIVGLILVGTLAADHPKVTGGIEEILRFEGLRQRKPFQRFYWVWRQRAAPIGRIPAGALLRAKRQIDALESENTGVTRSTFHWINVGAAPIAGGRIGLTAGARPMSGRVADVAVDPSNAAHWLIGAAQGGIWETRDAGVTWSARSDEQVSLAMGAIAFAPGNPSIVYAGTGEAVYSTDAYGGAGLLRSTDGGRSWGLVSEAPFVGNSVSDILVDPADADHLLVATTYGFAGRSTSSFPAPPATGIYRSSDGGNSWTLALAGAATDLERHPSDFGRLYAGIGDLIVRNENGVYRSTDAGASWAPINGPWESDGDGVGRVELAIAPSNPNVLYVGIQDGYNVRGTDGGLLGLWRTDDAWDPTPSWTRIDVTETDNGTGNHGYCGYNPAFNSLTEQCWYDHELIVDPTNPDILYAGGIALWKYNGTSWSEVSHLVDRPEEGIHADQHTMAWAGNRLLVGNDGGIWSSTDGGATWEDHNTNLAITQFYEGAIHPEDPFFAVGGAQDNGSMRWNGPPTGWRWVLGGDGADNVFSRSNPDTDWALSFQSLAIRRTRNAGASFERADIGINKNGAAFISRFEQCPADENVVIAGTDNLWKTTEFFSAEGSPSWTANSGDIGAPLLAMAFAPSDGSCQTYAVGGGNGALFLTRDGGGSWTNIDPENAVPNRFVTDLAFDPQDANVLYVALSGFDEGTPGQPGHLFKSAGLLSSPTWSDVSPPVDLPINTIVIDPQARSHILAGSDLGVFESLDGGGNWNHFGPESGMPNIAVFDLQMTDAQLLAFTHGRSVFMRCSNTAPDRDADCVVDGSDNCPDAANPEQRDTDGDGSGDVCDPNIDDDAFPNDRDNCPDVVNDGQEDLDGDGEGDACDSDIDGDGIVNDEDNCPRAANEDQADSDNDGVGDACDDDRDNDGVPDDSDNCPEIANENQSDQDLDGVGDPCDCDPTNTNEPGEDGVCPGPCAGNFSPPSGSGIPLLLLLPLLMGAALCRQHRPPAQGRRRSV